MNEKRITVSPGDVLSVDECFTSPNRVMVIPAGRNPEAVRQQFDKPDELVVCTDTTGRTLLVRRTSHLYRQVQVADRAAARLGITPAKLAGLSDDEMERFMEVYQDEYAKEFGGANN